MGRRGVWISLALVLVIAIGIGGYSVVSNMVSKTKTLLRGSGCAVTAGAESINLGLDEAPNAATIAGVASRKKLPERAVVIAYATAEQESHIQNIDYGDRDSVGIFQQRPSQGWGRVEQLTDPVYSTSRFFDALKKVKNYHELPLHVAAQRVQRSADGSLYAQHETMAEILAEGFTGRLPAAVRCWYPEDEKGSPDRPKAIRELRRTFGSSVLPTAENDGVKASGRLGWSVASWAVTHAQMYGLTEIRHADRKWTPADGAWVSSPSGSDRVIIR